MKKDIYRNRKNGRNEITEREIQRWGRGDKFFVAPCLVDDRAHKLVTFPA